MPCRSASIAITIANWPWPTRWPRSTRGRRIVQGTINGFGERCGNADLISVIANLSLKKQGYELLAARRRRPAHRAFPLRLRNGQHELPRQPAVRGQERLCPQGRNARQRRRPHRRQLRTHRAGTGRQRAAHSGQRAFRPVEHRRQRPRTITLATTRNWPTASWPRWSPEENAGYQFEAADASFDLLVRKCRTSFGRISRRCTTT